MKIAIDLVCTSNNSGSKTYNSKFLKYLSKQKIDNEIIIFICKGLYNSLKKDLEINKKINSRKIKMYQMHRDEALEAFKIWDKKEDKIKY